MTSRFVPAMRAVFGGVLLIIASGCGSAEPKTHPVSGKVVVKNGDMKKLVGGFVRFQSVADSSLIGVGEIQDDGSFGVGTFIDGKPRGGLPEGEYRARVEPRGFDRLQEDDAPPAPKRGDILAKYLKFDASGLKYTIKPGDNPLTVEVEAQR